MLRIRKNDQVMIMTGKDKGKRGKVIHIFPETQRALVEGINLVKAWRTRSRKPRRVGRDGITIYF